MEDFKFDFVVPSQLDTVFNTEVIPRLPLLVKKAGVPWDAPVLLRLLQDHTLLLGSITKSDKIVGIVILQECTNLFTAARFLHVWAAHFSTSKGILRFFEKTLDALADVFAYEYVRFSSARPGWRKLQDENWRFVYSVWEKRYVG